MNAFKSFTQHEIDAHNARVAARRAKSPSAQSAVAPVQDSFKLDNDRAAYTLVLRYPPSQNHYNLQRVVAPRNPKKKPFVMFYPSTEAKAFKESAARIARNSGVPVLQGHILVVLRVYRPRRAGDLDNVSKVVFDALNRVAWNDDSQITRIESERFDDPANPRVEVIIQERV